MIYNPSEQLTEMNQATIDQAVRLANIALQNAEKLVKVQLEASKTALEDGVKGAKALSELKDVQEVVAMRAKFAEASVEKALAYSRSVYEVAAETQAELTKFVEESMAGYTRSISALVDSAAKSAPAGSDAAVNALKSTFAATTAAIETLTKATKQAASFADASVKAATQATSAAVKQPAGRKVVA